MSLAEEIAAAKITEGDGWEAVIACSPEAAKVVRAAAGRVEPYGQSLIVDGGVLIRTRRPPRWPRLLHLIQNEALDSLLVAS